MISNLGTRLFQSVSDKAGDLGEKFEEEFARLSGNITGELAIEPLVQVILLMPTEDGKYRKASNIYSDPQTRNILDRIQRDSFELFHNDYEEPVMIRKKPPRLGEMKNI
ncbi:unnamed protein product [Haemonchus placei]|uniref:Nucleoid-associated protein YejK n=1 Tax=Haemonchus placei TaxID=6290 RepID=A0A0N4X6Q9_HAEPC|nr:unnamed protein product [Haemonchus placei]